MTPTRPPLRFWLIIAAALLVACSDPEEPNTTVDQADEQSEQDLEINEINELDAAQPDELDSTDSSQGHGGLSCVSEGTVSVDGSSYAYCVAKVGALELKIVEPQAVGDAPLRLALYFHGDGAGPYTSGLALKKHAPFTSTHGILYVAAKAPNGCAWWLSPEYTVCDGQTPIPDEAIDRAGENAEAVQELIETLRGAWDISNEPILLGGSSGGSIFLTANFLPRFGEDYPGYYALSCGGAPPYAGALDWEANSEARDRSALSFTYGDKDFVLEDVEAAAAFYEGLQFSVSRKVVEETGAPSSSHCGNVGGTYSYDQLGRVPEAWSELLAAED